MTIFSFKKPKNKPEIAGTNTKPEVPGGLYKVCEKCKKANLREDFEENLCVCTNCGAHHRVGARRRIEMTCDKGSFKEIDALLESKNVLNFPDYNEKLEKAKQQSGEREAVICGEAAIKNMPCAVFAMEHRFMMGSMGTATGEKIARLFDYARERSLPVIGFTVSGGARMQEGMLSLMQMAKTSGAVMLHSEAGLLYIAVLTDPTTGGVTASFAMEADITLAEPQATVGFAGARVIEGTMRQKLPPNFQTAEFVKEKGFIDAIVSRNEMRKTLAKLLAMHKGEAL